MNIRHHKIFCLLQLFSLVPSLEGNSIDEKQACDEICWDGLNCFLDVCKGCPFSCGGTCEALPSTCMSRCFKKEQCAYESCKSCLVCNESKVTNRNCPIATFEDRTHDVFHESSDYWYQFRHSGRPYFHDTAPLLIDFNGDNVLDYFNSMHGHPIVNISSWMELGLTEKAESHGSSFSLKQYSNRIILDEGETMIDAHGSVIADLDGDGHLDILISTGGGQGILDEGLDPMSYDNLLLWGEQAPDGDEYTIFRGGKESARKAGVEMRLGRGRYMHMLDVNGDGLPDLFSSQDRVVSNDIVPGILLINQGNRTWTKEESMTEFTRSMMLTDADGDNYANEILLTRGFCYPRRKDSHIDQSYPQFGAFTDDVRVFCSTRPAGSTAIYRFNKSSMQMEEISKHFSNFGAFNSMQPACCKHGLWNGASDCTIVSIASGDFDGDQKADQIYLYKTKLIFFFSTDRQKGEFPGDPNHARLELKLPKHCEGFSIRIVDFDNDGSEEIFIVCENAGIFLLYTQGSSKTDWSLQNGCNEKGALGEINNLSLLMATDDDLIEFCQIQNNTYWKTAMDICDNYQKKNKLPTAKTTGVSIFDLNNDGFLDVVTVHSFGYLRFFYNTPTASAKVFNRFITFVLTGEGVIKHNGIGLTLILWCNNESNGEVFKQFREIVSYHCTTDRSGTQDSKVIFGLGGFLSPFKLDLRFPDKTVRSIDLNDWTFSRYNNIININKLLLESEEGGEEERKRYFGVDENGKTGDSDGEGSPEDKYKNDKKEGEVSSMTTSPIIEASDQESDGSWFQLGTIMYFFLIVTVVIMVLRLAISFIPPLSKG